MLSGSVSFLHLCYKRVFSADSVFVVVTSRVTNVSSRSSTCSLFRLGVFCVASCVPLTYRGQADLKVIALVILIASANELHFNK